MIANTVLIYQQTSDVMVEKIEKNTIGFKNNIRIFTQLNISTVNCLQLFMFNIGVAGIML